MSSNKISVVFPGQGSQYPQMLIQYIDNLSSVRSTFEESSDLLRIDLIKTLKEGSKEDLSKTRLNIAEAAAKGKDAMKPAAFNAISREAGAASGIRFDPDTNKVISSTGDLLNDEAVLTYTD